MLKDKKMGQNGQGTDYPYLRFIPCQVEPGLFRGEYLVHVEAVDQSTDNGIIRVQLFVDEDEVKNLKGVPEHRKPVPGWLRVALASADEGLACVVLPQPALPVGESMFVRVDDLIKENVP